MARVSRQAAVIPYRLHAERIEIALVTSRRGDRWVVPKGSLDDGEAPAEAAIRETEEEAGLIGELLEKPIGRYRYTKRNDWYDVDIFVMRVTAVLDSWEEAKLRRRRFMSVDDALARLHPDLHGFVRDADQLARSNDRRTPRIQRSWLEPVAQV